MTLGAAPQADTDLQALLQVQKYREVFALLVPRYREKVFRLTFSMLRNHAMAEDATQDVFLRVWRALPGFAGQSSLSTWIYAIARNACLSELRKKRPTVSMNGDGDEYDAEVAALAAPDPDDSATVSVGQLLDQLPERYRQAVTLFYMEVQVNVANAGATVTLLKGKVHVAARPTGGQERVASLQPGQRLRFDADGTLGDVQIADLKAAQGWTEGKLYVDNWRLQDFVIELNRYGGAQLRIDDPALRDLRISGVFQTRNRENLTRLLAQGWDIQSRQLAPDEVLLTRQ